MKKYNITEFEFSQAHLFFWDKIERTNYWLETFIKTRKESLDSRLMAFMLTDPYSDGGQWDMIVNLINKYGLVPKEQYPETHTSENTRQLNKLITSKVPPARVQFGNFVYLLIFMFLATRVLL